MINKSPTFCVLPFLSIATAPSGNLRVCCNSIHGKNLILKPDGSPYKIDKDDLKQAWNSPSYKKISNKSALSVYNLTHYNINGQDTSQCIKYICQKIILKFLHIH